MSDWGNWEPLRSARARDAWETMAEDLPVDVLPCSNDEYFPPPPSPEQKRIMAIADAEVERWRRKFNMSRREFVRTRPRWRSASGRSTSCAPASTGTTAGAQRSLDRAP